MGLLSLVLTRVIEAMIAAAERKRQKDFQREVFLLGLPSSKGCWGVAMMLAKYCAQLSFSSLLFSSHGVLKYAARRLSKTQEPNRIRNILQEMHHWINTNLLWIFF